MGVLDKLLTAISLASIIRYFMISGLKGSGVKDLSQYLMEQVRLCCSGHL